MEITLDTRKTLEQNAAIYFEKAKKAKKKIEGIKKALEQFRTEKEKLLKKKEKAVSKEKQKIQEKKEKKERQRAKQWYEKFHWFISSEGFLCIGGKDATTNEIIIKKHTDKKDVVFHTEAPGSPFFVIKTEGRLPGAATLNETAIATASYSRAWKLGLSSVLAFYVSPEQVSKKAMAGEYLQKGSFMIYGKRVYSTVNLELGIGVLPDNRVMGGPVEAVKKNCGKLAIVVQGKMSKSDAAKKIQKIIGGELDEIMSALPAGDFEIK
ncbi:MAG: NFACT RNA binding domain-containing protein [Candidatus Woesearchaeota archaeon]